MYLTRSNLLKALDETGFHRCALRCRPSQKKLLSTISVVGLLIATFSLPFAVHYSIKAVKLIFSPNLACTCEIAEEGTWETVQQKHYFEIKSAKFFEKFHALTSPNSYSFHVNYVTTTSCCAYFTITENIKGKNISSAGGSSFLVTAISNRHLVTCSTTDHFNGLYSVMCPLYELCVNVTAEVFYGNYGAFYERQYKESSTFWTHTPCKSNAINANKDYQLPNGYNGWYRSNKSEEWSWVKITNSSLQKISNDQLRTCLNSVTIPVHFIGDSHLRSVLFYLMKLFNDLSPELAATKLRRSLDYKNFHYDFSAHLTDDSNLEFPPFFPRAKRLLNQYLFSQNRSLPQNATKRQIFVFSVGVWDIAKESPEYLNNHVIPQLTDFMIKLHRLAQTYEGKVIYLTSPPSFRKFAKKEDGRNNAKIAAYNKLVIDAVRPHGVTIVNFFAMVLNRYREANADGHHFYNDAGENVSRELLYQLCQ